MFYRPLTHENLCAIVDLLVKDLQKRLAARQLSVTVTDAARSYIVEAGSDPVYGARPLKRFLQSRVNRSWRGTSSGRPGAGRLPDGGLRRTRARRALTRRARHGEKRSRDASSGTTGPGHTPRPRFSWRRCAASALRRRCKTGAAPHGAAPAACRRPVWRVRSVVVFAAVAEDLAVEALIS